MIGSITRVMVMFDAVSDYRTALETAARLAARWQVGLHGVFVEDEDLRRLATLPFARQVSFRAGVEALTAPQIEGQMRAFAEVARRDLNAAAGRHHLEAAFEVVRGGEIPAPSTSDLVVACSLTRPVGGHFRLECRAWPADTPAPASLLQVHRENGTVGAVAALLRDREAGSIRLLEAAATLAMANDAGLTVLCPPALARETGFGDWLKQRLAAYPVSIAVEEAPAQLDALVRRIAELECGIVAISADAADAAPQLMRSLLARGLRDILVVR